MLFIPPPAALQFQPGFDPCQMKASGGGWWGGGVYSPSLSGFFAASCHLGILQAFPRLSLNVSQRGRAAGPASPTRPCRDQPGPAGRRPLDSWERPRHERVPAEREFGLFITGLAAIANAASWAAPPRRRSLRLRPLWCRPEIQESSRRRAIAAPESPEACSSRCPLTPPPPC